MFLSKIKHLFLCVIALTPTTLSASADVLYPWRSIKVMAEKDISVEIELSKELDRISTFNVSFDGKTIHIPADWYSDIVGPQLSSIKISGGCSFTEREEEKLEAHCSKHISFDFYESAVNGITIPEDVWPDWYAMPRVIYYFKDHHLSDRLILVNTSETTKKSIWKNRRNR